MNAVYVTYFPEPRPTRTTVGVAALVGKARIEITVTARKAQAGGKTPR
jgi:enamine deaminase RidA (YjgF/YER057c/UK114 family)